MQKAHTKEILRTRLYNHMHLENWNGIDVFELIDKGRKGWISLNDLKRFIMAHIDKN